MYIHTKSFCFNHKLFVCLLYETCKIKCHNQKIGVKTFLSDGQETVSFPLCINLYSFSQINSQALHPVDQHIINIFYLDTLITKIKRCILQKENSILKIHCTEIHSTQTFTNAILHLNGNFYLRLLAKYQTHICFSSYLRG